MEFMIKTVNGVYSSILVVVSNNSLFVQANGMGEFHEICPFDYSASSDANRSMAAEKYCSTMGLAFVGKIYR